ncbi:MAG: hypothetical protein ACI3ZY_00595 [Parabacteroides sp.]
MTIDQSKQEILSLLGRCPSHPLDERVRAELATGLSGASTASELAEYVADYIGELFETYGYELIDVLKLTLTPQVWQKLGVLFNPLNIPADGPDSYIALHDGAYVVEQAVDKCVIYYGDPLLSVGAGEAHVMDSANDIQVNNQAKAYVYGSTRCRAYDQAEVFYRDQSRGEAFHDAVVHACDRSYVIVGHDRVPLYAQDQAMFLASYGSPTIHMSGHCRGYINLDSYPRTPVRVQLADSCVLYAKGLREEDIQIKEESFKGTIIRGEGLEPAEGMLMDLIIPEALRRGVREDRLEVPLPLEQLKADLCVYLPEDRFYAISHATSETEVCQRMTPYIQTMVDNGLTGAFLRSHFTEESLNANGIHAFSAPRLEPDLSAADTHYFFGEQLVQASDFPHMVLGFEKTLVIANGPSQYVLLQQEASGIALGSGQLQAYGSGQVLGLDASHVRVDEKVEARLLGNSHGWACGQSRVYGYDSSEVVGQGQASLVLCHESRATVHDQVRVLVGGHNEIIAHGDATIGYNPQNVYVHPTIKKESEGVKVLELDTPEAFRQFTQLFDQQTGHVSGVRVQR